MVRDGSISHKMFRRFKISRHMGGFSLLVCLHREGSAFNVCRAGLFVELQHPQQQQYFESITDSVVRREKQCD